jgi:dihydrofolate reductase
MAGVLTVDLFVSVDGWAGSEGLPGYFGYFGPELGEWITAELAAPQVLIMGRRTYDLLAELPAEAQDESWERTMQHDKVVFSRSLQQVNWPNTRICGDDAVDEIRRMKTESDTALRTVGSLSVARQLATAGLVDRLRLVTFPVIAAESGREAAFTGMADTDLELVAHRVLDGRVLLVEYRPTGKDIPRA